MPSLPRLLTVAAACVVLAGCGDQGDPADDLPDPTGASVPAPAPEATTTPPRQAKPSGAPVTDPVWLGQVDDFCTATRRAVNQLFTSTSGPQDPVGALAGLAREYRAAVERLARVNPPAARAAFQALTLAEGRESASRLDVAVERARAGDYEAATAAAGGLGGLLPDFPRDVLAATPACRQALVPNTGR